MRKTLAVAFTLATIFLLIGLSSPKPIDHSKKSDFHDVVTKPVAGSSDHEIGSTGSHYADFATPDLMDTVVSDDTKITGDVNKEKSSQLISRPIYEEKENLALKPGFEKPKPNHLLTSSETAVSGKPGSLVVTDSKPNSLTAGSPVTTSKPVSGGGVASFVTSSEPIWEELDNSATTLEPAGSLFSTLQNVDSGKTDGGGLPATAESDSRRHENSSTTLMPDLHESGDKLTPVVTGQRKNGASVIGSSFTMILLGILLIAGSQVI